jgi:pyruvate dehydrogenase E1 component alpha subunit
MDAEAVYATVTKAREMIEAGHGPIFIEAFTCRYEGHSVSDANSYRSAQEMAHCKAKDSLEHCKKRLREKWMCSEDEIEHLQTRAKSAVEDAVAYAESADEPDITALYEHVFVEER